MSMVETGIDDGAILGRERLGKAKQERLLIPVVLIFGIGQRTRRRHHRQESRDALHLHEACLEIGDVALQLGRSGIGYCASDDRPARGAGIGEDPGVVFAVELRKRLAIAAADDGDRRVLRLFRRIWPPGEAVTLSGAVQP
jgi:hypothetical protein